MRSIQAHVNNAPIIAGNYRHLTSYSWCHGKIAYDWKSLPANSLVVDVGGGVGTACLALAKEFPNLKFVVQNRQSVVEAGIEVHIPPLNRIDVRFLTVS